MKPIYLILFSAVVLVSTHLAFEFYNAAIITGLYLLIVLLFRFKKDIAGELIVSIMFALFITTIYKYTYVGNNIYIGIVNVYPLVFWTLGLVIIRRLYKLLGNKLLLTSFLYIALIFAFEFIFYHWLGIRTVGNNPGIFGLDIIHGTAVNYYFYILAGPVYLLVTKFLKVK